MRSYRYSGRLTFCCVLVNVAVLLQSPCCRAHGVEGRVLKVAEATQTVSFEYSDGSPVSYASVKIWSPKNDSLEYQNGRTDEHGRFSFLPDIQGQWRIALSDGIGHAVTLHHVVEESPGESSAIEGENSKSAPNRLLLGALGASLIMNLGFLVRLARRKQLGAAGVVRG